MDYEASHKDKIKKKILKIRNREESFDEVKENIVKDYIVDLVNKIQNERIIEIEKEEFENIAIKKGKLDKNYNLYIKPYKSQLLKYNTEKKYYE